MNKKNILFITISIIIIAIVASLISGNKKNNENIEPNKTLDVDIDGLLENTKKLNESVDDYYMKTFDKEDIYISYNSYLYTENLKEITIDDVKEAGYDIPKEVEEATTIHFVKPKSLKPYLKDGILDTETEILTVYTAIDTKDGVYISSKFDEGGLISNEQYREFLLAHNWAKGDVKMPKKGEGEYNNIMDIVIKNDSSLEDGNVKHIKHNEEYAVVVISKKDDPSYIKEYALQKNDGNWNILVDNLESVEHIKYINYNYTDFDLGLLPAYEIGSYEKSTFDADDMLEALIQKGYVDKNDKVTYYSGAGKFSYTEFESGKKMLSYINDDGISTIYEVDNFKAAISQMLKLEENPPVFILKFE